ncbi:hypothetical protein BD289DRAFT_177575 [Coniella lustricola]|uniref:Uncharacterized protein n=1 Tax=Coniella lustricola TaxID=2025994 RepID=A0A2T2ZTI3_9PEZI|nr:hypothetical protein BD289DRAFT_177575 [Coniella lustricola]
MTIEIESLLQVRIQVNMNVSSNSAITMRSKQEQRSSSNNINLNNINQDQIGTGDGFLRVEYGRCISGRRPQRPCRARPSSTIAPPQARCAGSLACRAFSTATAQQQLRYSGPDERMPLRWLAGRVVHLTVASASVCGGLRGLEGLLRACWGEGRYQQGAAAPYSTPLRQAMFVDVF